MLESMRKTCRKKRTTKLVLTCRLDFFFHNSVYPWDRKNIFFKVQWWSFKNISVDRNYYRKPTCFWCGYCWTVFFFEAAAKSIHFRTSLNRPVTKETLVMCILPQSVFPSVFRLSYVRVTKLFIMASCIKQIFYLLFWHLVVTYTAMFFCVVT